MTTDTTSPIMEYEFIYYVEDKLTKPTDAYVYRGGDFIEEKDAEYPGFIFFIGPCEGQDPPSNKDLEARIDRVIDSYEDCISYYKETVNKDRTDEALIRIKDSDNQYYRVMYDRDEIESKLENIDRSDRRKLFSERELVAFYPVQVQKNSH